MDVARKLEILADAAKYDASCASSGADKRNSLGGRGIGSTEGMGICHSYAPDGRCVSLLKILLTNFCTYDCLYCVNRVSSNVPRARFTVDEVVDLTLDFYKRNYIEGLFLSSGIIQSPDYTMEQVVSVARKLRDEHDFRGYIHLKTIPDASDALLAEAGRYADRLSINIELPSVEGLKALAPEKDARAIRVSMGRLRENIDAAKAERADANRKAKSQMTAVARPKRFSTGGQSTQMIVGADASDDARILSVSSNLYGSYRLKRVYYSAFSPIPDASGALPLKAPPLVREHRLYQADWLMRFYGFGADEIVQRDDGMLDLDVDPKLGWALTHRERFPVDINRASREDLLRVPGLGSKTVERLIASRRHRRIHRHDLARLRVAMAKVLPFVLLADHKPAREELDTEKLRPNLLQAMKKESGQLCVVRLTPRRWGRRDATDHARRPDRLRRMARGGAAADRRRRSAGGRQLVGGRRGHAAAGRRHRHCRPRTVVDVLGAARIPRAVRDRDPASRRRPFRLPLSRPVAIATRAGARGDRRRPRHRAPRGHDQGDPSRPAQDEGLRALSRDDGAHGGRQQSASLAGRAGDARRRSRRRARALVSSRGSSHRTTSSSRSHRSSRAASPRCTGRS